MNELLNKKKLSWQKFGRPLQVLLLFATGIWIWLRNFEHIENPDRIPLACWVIISSIMLSIHFYKFIKPWEAFLGTGAGFVIALAFNYVDSMNIIFVFLTPIIFEWVIQQIINRRLKVRHE
ncbi:hypothetical protein ACFSJY_06875 [Thalassotalea euphylliae]|uniref:hypothetical protein n=1 Tax=Thalassotalea euphylliae TaxID=1655234 RepID=UPI00362EB5D1